YNLRQGPQAGPRLRDALDRAIPFHAIDAVHGMPSAPAAAPVDRLDPQPIDLARLAQAGVSATWGMAGLPELAPDEDAEGARQAGLILDELGWTMERGTRRRATGPLRTVLLWDGERGTGAEVAGPGRRGTASGAHPRRTRLDDGAGDPAGRDGGPPDRAGVGRRARHGRRRGGPCGTRMARRWHHGAARDGELVLRVRPAAQRRVRPGA